MKPTTKLQKKVVELSSQLPKITEKQSQWAFKKLFDNYATKLNATMYCLECSNTWKEESTTFQDELIGCTCPECKKELKIFKHNGNCTQSNYFSILTIKGDFQIQRIVKVDKNTKKKTQADFSFIEVMQHWIGIDGKKTTLSLAVNGMSMYYDQWIRGSDLEVRTQSHKSDLRNNLSSAIYPIRKILPLIKRNGFKGHFYDLAPFKLFSILISKPKSELILKSNQIELLKEYISNPNRVDKYWNSIKICIRHNYLVGNGSDWLDMLDILFYFNRDLQNYKFICPVDLNSEHNRLVANKRLRVRKLKKNKLKEEIQISQVLYKAQKERFFGLEFSRKNLKIKVIETVNQFMEEGDLHNHCIFENAYYEKVDSLIFSATINSELIETVEVSLKDLKLVQSRGKGNQATKHHSDIIKLVNSNMHTIGNLVKITHK